MLGAQCFNFGIRCINGFAGIPITSHLPKRNNAEWKRLGGSQFVACNDKFATFPKLGSRPRVATPVA